MTAAGLSAAEFLDRRDATPPPVAALFSAATLVDS